MNKNPVSYFIMFLISLVVPKKYRFNKSLKYIQNYQISENVIFKFNLKRKLSPEQLIKTVEALKQFFMIYAFQIQEKNYQKYAIPSKVADELWHEFMLSSKEYADFCQEAFGKFLHHTPDSSKSNKDLFQFTKSSFNKPLNKDVLVTWDNLNKIKKNHKLYMIGTIPAIFALDSYLNIDDGFYYTQRQMELEMVLHNKVITKDNRRSSGSSGSGSSDLASNSYHHSDTSSDGGGGCGGGD